MIKSAMQINNKNSRTSGGNNLNQAYSIETTLEALKKALEPKEGIQFANALQVKQIAVIVENTILGEQAQPDLVEMLRAQNSPYLPIVEITLDRRGILEQGGHLNDLYAFHLAVENALLASRGVPTEIFYGAISILESVRGVSTASVLPLLEVYYEQLAAQNLDGEFVRKLLEAYRPNIELDAIEIIMLTQGPKEARETARKKKARVYNMLEEIDLLPPSAIQTIGECVIKLGSQEGSDLEIYGYVKGQVYGYFVLGGLTPANINKIKAKIINANSKLYGMQ